MFLACLTIALVFDDPASGAERVGSPNANIVDERVFNRLAELQIEPAKATSDTEFLRRLTQTTIGQLPTPEEIRRFVNDQTLDKRAAKIAELLRHNLHAALWATRYSEWTGNSIQTLAVNQGDRQRISRQWHTWLRDRFAENAPYDQIVTQVVSAQSRGDLPIDKWVDQEIDKINSIRNGQFTDDLKRTSLDLFWMRANVQSEYPYREISEQIASTFLGIRIGCARCHDHPFDQWKQSDYQSFVRVFEQVRHDMSPALRQEMSARLDRRRQRAAAGENVGAPLPRITEVYLAPLDNLSESAKPKALGGPEFDANQFDLRVAFADWMTSPSNRYFAKNFVNRVWAHYFGRGIVEPLDGLGSETDQIEYAELLEELSSRFVNSGFDVRNLESLILNSRTWQLSSAGSSQTNDDRHHFRSLVRLPTAEVVVDMWHSATGIQSDFGNPTIRGLRAIEIGCDQLPNCRWDPFMKLFGQPKRTETCDCSPKGRPSVRQVLTLMSDPHLMADLSNGTITQLASHQISADQVIETLFLQTLSRWPTQQELHSAKEVVDEATEPSGLGEAYVDILWALLNTQEFITIH